MLHISPKEHLMFEEVSIQVSGLRPTQHVTIRCEVTEGKFVFDSHAHFVGSLDGTVDLAKDGSFGGSYSGVSKMGIFWSMLPAKGQMNGLRYFPRKCMSVMYYKIQVYKGHIDDDSFQKSPLLLDIEDVGRQHIPLIEGVVLRKCNGEGVTRHEVKHGRVRGTIFKPPGTGPFKGIIDIYGGGGGINESRVALLASLGYIAFTLPHHNYPDLPKLLYNVDFEYFLEAVDYFSSLDAVQPNIGILSVCAGGAIAMYLSTQTNKISAVITFNAGYALGTIFKHAGKTFAKLSDEMKNRLDNPTAAVDERGGIYYPEQLAYDCFDEVAIEIEQSDAQFLMIAGTGDKTLNGLKSAQYMVNRMNKFEKGDKITLLAYPDAGHLIDPPYMPQTLTQYYPHNKQTMSCGGDVIPNAVASLHSWKQIQLFMNKFVGTQSKL